MSFLLLLRSRLMPPVRVASTTAQYMSSTPSAWEQGIGELEGGARASLVATGLAWPGGRQRRWRRLRTSLSHVGSHRPRCSAGTELSGFQDAHHKALTQDERGPP